MLKLPYHKRDMHSLVVSTGSNLGSKAGNIQRAMGLLGEILGSVQSASRIYASPAWGYESVNTFCNQCLEIQTGLDARECFRHILEIEKSFGRERGTGVYRDRIIDIDILFFDDLVLDTPELKIPHPRLQERNFVLVPLAEILPGLIHPVLRKPVNQLLADCPDSLEVVPLKKS